MRIYGFHSGRNNMNRLLARSFCRNSSKNFKSKEIHYNDKTDSTKSNDISDNEYATMILSGIFILIALLLCK